VVDDWGTYYEAARNTVLVKYSTMEFNDGNSWTSKINDWEKPARLERLVIQFGCLDTVGDGVEICKFTG
jgi:hypothetical protein